MSLILEQHISSLANICSGSRCNDFHPHQRNNISNMYIHAAHDPLHAYDWLRVRAHSTFTHILAHRWKFYFNSSVNYLSTGSISIAFTQVPCTHSHPTFQMQIETSILIARFNATSSCEWFQMERSLATKLDPKPENKRNRSVNAFRLELGILVGQT